MWAHKITLSWLCLLWVSCWRPNQKIRVPAVGLSDLTSSLAYSHSPVFCSDVMSLERSCNKSTWREKRWRVCLCVCVWMCEWLGGVSLMITQCSTVLESRITGICACRLPAQTTSKPHATAPLSLFLGWQHWLWFSTGWSKDNTFFPLDNVHVWPCWEGPHSERLFHHSNEGLWMPRWPCMLSWRVHHPTGSLSGFIELLYFHNVMLAHTVGLKGTKASYCLSVMTDQKTN